MYIKELESLGLTQREIKVYQSLLEIGFSSVGKIIEKSGIPGSKIYETLTKLKDKGLVSCVIKDNKKFFKASNPKTILNYLDEQRRLTSENIIPKLESLQKTEKQEQEATIYQGIKGIKAIYEKMLRELNKNETLYVLGAPKIAQEKLETFLLNFNKRRIKKGIKMKIIYHEDAKEYGKKREKMKLTEVKYIPKEIITPSWTDIFGNYIVIFNINKPETAVIIKDENISRSFTYYFRTIWKIAKK